MASESGNKQRLFWYVHGLLDRRTCAFVAAAFTEASARRQVERKYKGVVIDSVTAVNYSHAWLIDHRLAKAQPKE